MKYLKIAFFVAIAIFVSYWFVQFALTIWDKTTKTNVWSFIPADAIAVCQLTDAIAAYQKADSTVFWQNLKTSPALKHIDQRAELANILIGEGIAIDQYLQDKPLTISLHTTAKGNFDFLFFVPITLREHTIFRNILQNLISRHESKTEKRNYQGIEIQEVKFKDSPNLFSYCIYKGYFVGSFTSFLVEETIRNLNELGRNNFYTTNKKIFDLHPPQITDNHAVIYFNSQKFSNFLSIFYKENLQTNLQNFDYLPNGYLQIDLIAWANQEKKQKNALIFKGLQQNLEILPTDLPKHLQTNILAAFPKLNEEASLTTEGGTNIFQFIPKKTAFFYKFDLSTDKKTFFENLQKIDKLNRDSLILAESLDFSSLQSFFEGEVAFTEAESFSKQYADKLLFIKVVEPARLNKKLQSWATELSVAKKDTLQYENIGNQKVIKLNFAELPKKIFGQQAFAGFPTAHFTFINNYLVLGNTPKALAVLLEDLDNEQVWAKMYKNSTFLETLQQPAHYTQAYNILRAWNYATQDFKPEWQAIFEENKRNLLRFEFLTIQQTANEDEIATTVGLFHEVFRGQQAQQTGQPIQRNLRTMYATNFYNTLISKPFVVLNPLDKSKEIIVQDAGNHLHLLSNVGKKMWHFGVGTPINKNIYQVWSGNNSYYLFSSQNKIFLLDRNGNLAAGFPITIEEGGNIEFLALLDYDNTKNYRITAADEQGNVFMLSKNGQILQGWSPKKLAGQLATNARHIRAGGKDGLLLINKQGIVNLFKRNGELYAGFPVYVGNALTSSFFIQQGIDFQQTILHLQTTQGETIHLNLLGKVVSRVEMDRPSTQSICKLVLDASSAQDYILSRQDDKLLSVFAKNITLLFSKEFDNNSEKLVQYFNFGVHAELVAITDREQKKTYLYHKNGDSLGEPLESEQEITVFYNEIKQEFLIYKVVNKEVSALRIWRN
jgi:hypothetical protein